MKTFGFNLRATSLIGLFISLAIGNLSAEDNAKKTLAVSAKTPPKFFQLYCGNCSRSMKHHKTYASIDDVGEAVEAQRAKWKRTVIVSTDREGHNNLYSTSGTITYRVYVGTPLRCRIKWDLRSEHKSHREAIGVVASLKKKSNDPVEIVRHHSQPPESLAGK